MAGGARKNLVKVFLAVVVLVVAAGIIYAVSSRNRSREAGRSFRKTFEAGKELAGEGVDKSKEAAKEGYSKTVDAAKEFKKGWEEGKK